MYKRDLLHATELPLGLEEMVCRNPTVVEGVEKRPIYICKRDVYICKRDIHICNRAAVGSRQNVRSNPSGR